MNNSGKQKISANSHPSNREIRVLPHHLLVNLHQRSRMSTMVKIGDLNMHNHSVVWHKGVVSFLPAPSVVKTTLTIVVRATLVVLSVVTPGISFEIVQIIRREMVVGAI